MIQTTFKCLKGICLILKTQETFDLKYVCDLFYLSTVINDDFITLFSLFASMFHFLFFLYEVILYKYNSKYFSIQFFYYFLFSTEKLNMTQTFYYVIPIFLSF